MIDLSKKKITGYWDEEPIWREKTPEEKLQESMIDQGLADLFIILNNKQYDERD